MRRLAMMPKVRENVILMKWILPKERRQAATSRNEWVTERQKFIEQERSFIQDHCYSCITGMWQRSHFGPNEIATATFSHETPHDGSNETHKIILLSEPQRLMRLYIARLPCT